MPDMVRLPLVAGSFYPAGPQVLRSHLAEWLGDATLASAAPLADPAGLIAPHAGIVYSGSVAAAGYAGVAKRGRPSRVVVLGASHTGWGAALGVAPHEVWRTPLGDSPVDVHGARHLANHGFELDVTPFLREHSIELQLPFIQYLWGTEVPVLPICVRPVAPGVLLAAGQTLAEWIGDSPTLVVTSSDFTHYEPVAAAAEADRAAFDTIAKLDARAFLVEWSDREWTLCGAGAIAVLMETARRLKWTRVDRIAYATSGDVTGDRTSVVGYAAISLSREDSS